MICIDQASGMLLEPLIKQCIAERGRECRGEWQLAGQCVFSLASSQIIERGKGPKLLSPPERFPPTPLALVPSLPTHATDGRLPDGSHQKARTYSDPAG